MKKLIALVILCTATVSVTAEEKALQLSLTPDVALYSRDTFIKGLSLSIWGENPQSAFALGFVNGSTGESSGFSWGLVNYAERYTGLQLGVVNYAREEFKGLQWGGVNVATHASGVQCGFVNYSESFRGVQLGFVNIITDNSWFDEFPDRLAVVFPFVNWSF
ncbi:MAG TPA: hypothetical protein P5205_19995 [Candidatus Paceibacterota bacterium]|nr:hypothetical protein [Verrucomicrobiota bacterium]HSA12648.1 hypothetical protein [Candidatus Paceibacterota bacterium]